MAEVNITSWSLPKNYPAPTFTPNGISVGMPFLDLGTYERGPVTGGIPTHTSNAAFARWGMGVPQSTSITLTTTLQPPTTLCTFQGGTVGLSSGYGTLQANGLNGFTTFEGKRILQLDWPQAVAFTLTESNSTPLAMHVWGVDWYGNGMYMKFNPPSAPPGFLFKDAGTYSCVSVPGGDYPYASGLAPTNKTFGGIYAVYMQGQLDAGNSLIVESIPCIGLPYVCRGSRYVETVSLFNDSEWGIPLSDPQTFPAHIQLLGKFFSAQFGEQDSTSYDVRGSYYPSMDLEEPTIFTFKYIVQGVNTWNAMMHAAGKNVAPENELTLFGYPQYNRERIPS